MLFYYKTIIIFVSLFTYKNIVMTVTAQINVETEAGRKIVRELEKHTKLVKINYPEPVDENGLPIQTIPFEQCAKEAFDLLGDLYGIKFNNKYTR